MSSKEKLYKERVNVELPHDCPNIHTHILTNTQTGDPTTIKSAKLPGTDGLVDRTRTLKRDSPKAWIDL